MVNSKVCRTCSKNGPESKLPCAKCKEWFLVGMFNKGRGRYHPYCKECHKKIVAAWKLRNPQPKSKNDNPNSRQGRVRPPREVDGKYRCIRCNAAKDVEEYKPKKDGSIPSFCIECRKVATGQNYAKTHRPTLGHNGVSASVRLGVENVLDVVHRVFCEINGVVYNDQRVPELYNSGWTLRLDGDKMAERNKHCWEVFRFCGHGVRDEKIDMDTHPAGPVRESNDFRREEREFLGDTVKSIDAAFKKFMMKRGLWRSRKEINSLIISREQERNKWDKRDREHSPEIH